MKLHVVALPHTQVTDAYLTCAYTQKVARFGKMMAAKGYESILYAGEVSDAEGYAEHVVCVTEEERTKFFGAGFDTVLTPLRWDPAEPYWRVMADRAIPALRERGERGDLLLMIGGNCQKPISDALSDLLLPVEWGVGYEGIYTNFRAFESYAWMHHVYGLRRIIDGGAFDAVIPNFFDAADFHKPRSRWPETGDYLLYMGRMIERKGPHIAANIAERCKMPIIFAGPGARKTGGGITYPGPKITYAGASYAGEADAEERRELMSKARALLVPTVYVEPFGGVAAEAMLAGTPVVASDWGAFTETVTPEVGRRFHTPRQGAEAVLEALELPRGKAIHDSAKARFGLDAVGGQFARWFAQLETLWGVGYDAA